MSKPGIRFSTAVIMVRDMAASRSFYEGLLGQRVLMDHGENVVFLGGFSIWESTHAGRIIFGGDAERINTGCYNLELYFESEDIAGVFRLFEEAGVHILQHVHEEPWGQRTFRCQDPDGHIVEIGEPMKEVIRRLFSEKQPPEAIVKRTSMPMEVVLQAIGYPRFC